MLSLDEPTKVAIVLAVICAFALVIILMACIMCPCPLNRLLFKDDYDNKDELLPFNHNKDSNEYKKKFWYLPWRPPETNMNGSMPNGRPTNIAVPYSISRQASSNSTRRNNESSSNSDAASPRAETYPNVVLKFSINREGNELQFLVQSASNTPGPVHGLAHNNFVKLELTRLRKKRRKKNPTKLVCETRTKIVSRTPNPVFNEMLTLKYPKQLPVDIFTLRVSCCDYDKYGNEDTVGYFSLQVALIDDTYKASRQEVMEIPEQNNYGELLLSLSYLPTSEKLNMVVLKARNMKPSNSECLNPYVKVQVLLNGQKALKKRTDIKVKDLNPIFNETMVFDVPARCLPQVVVIITMLHWEFNSDCDAENKRAHHVVGRFSLGAKCYGLGYEHWKSMHRNPRTQVAHWHKLH